MNDFGAKSFCGWVSPSLRNFRLHSFSRDGRCTSILFLQRAYMCLLINEKCYQASIILRWCVRISRIYFPSSVESFYWGPGSGDDEMWFFWAEQLNCLIYITRTWELRRCFRIRAGKGDANAKLCYVHRTFLRLALRGPCVNLIFASHLFRSCELRKELNKENFDKLLHIFSLCIFAVASLAWLGLAWPPNRQTASAKNHVNLPSDATFMKLLSY